MNDDETTGPSPDPGIPVELEPAARGLWSMREQELLDRVDQAFDHRLWSGILAKAQAAGDVEGARVARTALDRRPVVTGLDGLAATARLVDQLTGSRWILMQSAREAGASWDQVGEASGLTGEQARSWYGERIALQERYVPQFHDTARSRAVLDDADSDQSPAGPPSDTAPTLAPATGDDPTVVEPVEALDDGAGW